MRRHKEEEMASTSRESTEDEIEIEEVTSNKNLFTFESVKNQIIYRSGSQILTISKDDLEKLIGNNYLNDKIIEFYLFYVKDNLTKEMADKTHIFNSFFFSKMLETRRNYKNDNHFYDNLYLQVHRWTNNIDIFSYDFLIIPIFKGCHWSVAIICYPGKLLIDEIELDVKERPCIIFFDSIKQYKDDRMKTLKQYSQYLKNFIQQELFNKKNISKVFNSANLPTLNPTTPCQNNDYDCGIFLLHYVETFLKKPDVIFESSRLARVSLRDWFKPESIYNKRSQIGKILLEIHQNNKKEVNETNPKKNLSEDEISVVEDNSKNENDDTTIEISKVDSIYENTKISDKKSDKISNDKVVESKSSNSIDENTKISDKKIEKSSNDKVVRNKSNSSCENTNSQHKQPSNSDEIPLFNYKSTNQIISFDDLISNDSILDNIFEPEIDIQVGQMNLKLDEFGQIEKTNQSPSSSNISPKKGSDLLLTSRKEKREVFSLSYSASDLILTSPDEVKRTNPVRTRNLSINSNKKMKSNNFSMYDFEGLIDISRDDEE